MSDNLQGREKQLNRLEDFLKLAPAQAEQVELVLETAQVAVTRYAHNRIHQNVYEEDTRLWVRVLVGGAVASLACNSLTLAQVKATLAQATEQARRLPNRDHPGFAARSDESGANVEPGSVGLVIPGQGEIILSAPSFYTTTAGQTPDQRAEAIRQVVEPVQSAGLEGYGTYKTSLTELAVANSRGLRAYAAATSGYLKALVENVSGSAAGYADMLDRDVSRLDPLAVAAIAIEKCRLNQHHIALAPGDYAVVLEPNALADLVRFMVIHGCGAQELQDSRSFMTGRFGEAVTGANINLWEDPGHPQAMPFPLDYDGLEARPVPLVIAGKAAGVVYDRATARQASDHLSTGHAPNPWDFGSDSGPLPEHIVMSGGSRSTQQLVGDMKRGLLITRLHYTHCPDPRRVVATGTTRDGTFLVENGEIVAAVKNMRLTQSVLELLAGVEELGQPKTCQDWWAANGMGTTSYYLPSLRASHCSFIGTTTF